MQIYLTKEIEQALTTSIRRYVSENRDIDIGELQASLFLQYCFEEICPCAYNSAITDAQRYMQEKVSDLENACYAQEFGYWKKKTKGTGIRRKSSK
jgi:uncharacterized protein (DUF2164 family)